ncbi:MAG: hypothetical protein LBK83_08110 [Treponema sp.]|jgi:hypothetical protein|nr:hypothetical protein [Treponema sp.]
MKCQWCGRDIFYGDNYWHIDGKGVFCSQKCLDEWKWEKGGGKADAEWNRHVERLDQEWQQEKEAYRRQQAEENSKRDAEKEHFRPFIEERLGHPLKLDEIWWNQRTGTWAAKEEILAEVGAAMKMLEQESGIKISAIPDVMYFFQEGQMSWFSSRDRWGFKVPPLMAIHEYKAGNNQSGWNGNNLTNDVYWVTPESLAPYLSVAEYEGRKIQDLGWPFDDNPEYLLLPDRSYVISGRELSNVFTRKRKWGGTGGSRDFFPLENKFISQESRWKSASLLKKGHSVENRLEVSLNDLKILIPVKKIQVRPVPAAPKPAKTAPVQPAANSAAAPKFCGQCGSPLPGGAKFCGSCGAKTG